MNLLADLTISLTPVTDSVNDVATATLSGCSLVIVAALAVGGLIQFAKSAYEYFKQQAADTREYEDEFGPDA